MKSNSDALALVDLGVECLIHIKENNSIRKKPADHTKVVNCNAKHVQKSTDDRVVGSWEAIPHRSNLLIESSSGAVTMNIPLAVSEAKERISVTTAKVRVQMLFQASSICRKPTESLYQRGDW